MTDLLEQADDDRKREKENPREPEIVYAPTGIWLMLPVDIRGEEVYLDGKDAVDLESGGNVAYGWFEKVKQTLKSFPPSEYQR